MFLSLIAMICGAFLFETVLSPGPTIPAPTHRQEQMRAAETQTMPSGSPGQSYTLSVYPKDADRLARTLESDVSAHGGWTIRNDHDRSLTFAVSDQYLERIQPLINASGTGPVGKEYREYAHTVGNGPDPTLIGETTDTSLTVNLAPAPPFNDRSLITIGITGAVAAFAFLVWVCLTASQP